MISLTDQQLRDFQDAVAWETGMRLPDGRVLGVPGKRGRLTEGTDSRVRLVAERLDPGAKRILELGCHEAIHTVQLAAIAREVVALEVRPRNVIGALVRLFVHDVQNARVVLADVRHLDESLGAFDILFHVGVLYHLANPVEHLLRAGSFAHELVLDTHYAVESTPGERADLRYGDKVYPAVLYREGGWRETFSGVEPTSRWLTRQALLELVADAGFAEIEVVEDRVERNGNRMTLLAHKRRDR